MSEKEKDLSKANKDEESASPVSSGFGEPEENEKKDDNAVDMSAQTEEAANKEASDASEEESEDASLVSSRKRSSEKEEFSPSSAKRRTPRPDRKDVSGKATMTFDVLNLILAFCALGTVLYQVISQSSDIYWWALISFALILVAFQHTGSSLSEFGFAGRSNYVSLVLIGAIVGTNTFTASLVALAAFAYPLSGSVTKRSPKRRLFNALQYMLCAAFAGYIYSVSGGYGRVFTIGEGLRSLLPALLAGLAFWACGGLLVGIRWYLENDGRLPGRYPAACLQLLPGVVLFSLVGAAMGFVFGLQVFRTDVINPEHIVYGGFNYAVKGFLAIAMFSIPIIVAWFFSDRSYRLNESMRLFAHAQNKYLETREPDIVGHGEMVASYSDIIAKKLGYSRYKRRILHLLALMHDIGKSAISTTLLNGVQRLTDDEFEVITKHPLYSSNLIQDIPMLSGHVNAVAHHHEYYDGGGYIDGVQGKTIPEMSRIIAVADSYDSMLRKRPYRGALSEEEARAQLLQNSGKQFDPAMVDIFVQEMQTRRSASSDEGDSDAQAEDAEIKDQRKDEEADEQKAKAAAEKRKKRIEKRREKSKLKRSKKERKQSVSEESSSASELEENSEASDKEIFADDLEMKIPDSSIPDEEEGKE